MGECSPEEASNAKRDVRLGEGIYDEPNDDGQVLPFIVSRQQDCVLVLVRCGCHVVCGADRGTVWRPISATLGQLK